MPETVTLVGNNPDLVLVLQLRSCLSNWSGKSGVENWSGKLEWKKCSFDQFSQHFSMECPNLFGHAYFIYPRLGEVGDNMYHLKVGLNCKLYEWSET